jgi:hypothetical protein
LERIWRLRSKASAALSSGYLKSREKDRAMKSLLQLEFVLSGLYAISRARAGGVVMGALAHE